MAHLTLRDWERCDTPLMTRVLAWADHPDVPDHMSRGTLAACIFRTPGLISGGQTCLAVHSWVTFDNDRPVAFLAGEVRPTWVPPQYFSPAHSYTESPGPVMSFETLVDPALWGRGYAAAAKMAALDHPATAHITCFQVTIRTDNQRSLNAIAKIHGIELLGTAIEDGTQWHHYRWHRQEPGHDTES